MQDKVGWLWKAVMMARVSGAVALVVWVWCSVAAMAEYVKYKDPEQPVAIRVRDLLGRMTLEEKIGQMAQIDRSVANVLTMRTYSIGNYKTISIAVTFITLLVMSKCCLYFVMVCECFCSFAISILVQMIQLIDQNKLLPFLKPWRLRINH